MDDVTKCRMYIASSIMVIVWMVGDESSGGEGWFIKGSLPKRTIQLFTTYFVPRTVHTSQCSTKSNLRVPSSAPQF